MAGYNRLGPNGCQEKQLSMMKVIRSIMTNEVEMYSN